MYLGHSSSFWSEDKDLSFADWSAADYVPFMGASCIITGEDVQGMKIETQEK
jgi:hypothetical protein